MDNYSQNKLQHQQGAATLMVSIILLIAVTLLTIYAAQVSLQDQRISGNEVRHKEAFANAEAALDEAGAYLRANPKLHDGVIADGWVNCGGSTVFPCNVPGAVSILAATTVVSGVVATVTSNIPSVTANGSAYLVKTAAETIALGVGKTLDQTGSAQVQVSYVKKTLITPGEIPPIMAPTLNLNGNFTIVADPNNGIGTTGVPISGWTSNNTSGIGSWQTCHIGDYRDGTTICNEFYTSNSDNWSGCSCTTPLSDKNVPLADMLDIYTDSSGFPADPFKYVFGADATVDSIRARFKQFGQYYPGNCTGLDTLNLSLLAKPWVWVDGDCDVPNVGSITKPVILVVQGKMKLNASTKAWGLLISLQEVQSNGGAIVHGSLVAKGVADIANGGYTQVYDERVLTALTDDTTNTDIGKLKYSWHDF